MMKLDLTQIQNELGIKAVCFETIDSTSLYLKRQIVSGEQPFTLAVASHQTNGQGRVGKSFYSPKDTGLYFTFCFKSEDIQTSFVTPRVAVALCRALEEVFPFDFGVKWVNDIYLSNRKVAGVLCQNVKGYYLIGIGINVEKPCRVPKDLLGRFGYITEKAPIKSYENIIIRVYRNLFNAFSQNKSDVHEEFSKRCIHIGKNVSIINNGVEKIGRCVGISEDFSLEIDINGRVEAFDSGVMSICQ